MKRAGSTEKVSVSLQSDLLKTLRRRAKRLYAGNLSAVLTEVAEAAARLEAQDDLIKHFGWRPLSDAERAEIEAEWYPPTPKRKKAASA
ncbi:MAG: hypothetical protein JNK04_08675 [Myxococcales bacterium]|nr:hypothetical protein [Myxococcales bacterium]